MNSGDVTRLRKEGRLDEAHALALQLMEQSPGDLWNRRAYAWVLYAVMKREFEAGRVEQAQRHYSAFEALQMPQEEAMLYENFSHFRLRFDKRVQRAEQASHNKDYRLALSILWEIFQTDPSLAALPGLQTKIAWEIWHNLRELPADTGPALRCVNDLVQQYRSLNLVKKPDMVHSVVLSQLLMLPLPVRNLFDFSDWFRFWIIPDHFSEKDWMPYITQGFQLPSTAEKACNAWSKALIQHAKSLPAGELDVALQRLESVARLHPEFMWLPYYIGKIRLSGAGNTAVAREWLLPFVRLKHTEFWAWDLLADSWIAEDTAKAEACLCKAVICRTEPQFLAKVRLRLVQLFIHRQAYDAAKYEVETLLQLKESRGEQVAGELQRYRQMPWYAATVSARKAAQQAFYREQADRAEALVFEQDLIVAPGVVEGIDPNTSAVYYAVSPEVRGRFPGKRFPRLSFQPGDVFQFKLLRKRKNEQDYWELLALDQTQELPAEDICRDFSGKFHQFGQQPVGKIGEAFVPAHIVRAKKLTNGQNATVRAVWTYDPRRQQYGWKALR